MLSSLGLQLSRYPKGGFHRVLQAMVDVGKRLGVVYRFSSPVSKVNVSNTGHATGVTLTSGEDIQADLVLMNADLVYAYNSLLPNSSKATSLSKKPSSCSSISFYWAMDQLIPELHTHNVFLADEYQDSFDDIFKRQQIPKEPSFYLNVPSRVRQHSRPGPYRTSAGKQSGQGPQSTVESRLGSNGEQSARSSLQHGGIPDRGEAQRPRAEGDHQHAGVMERQIQPRQRRDLGLESFVLQRTLLSSKHETFQHQKVILCWRQYSPWYWSTHCPGWQQDHYRADSHRL